MKTKSIIILGFLAISLIQVGAGQETLVDTINRLAPGDNVITSIAHLTPEKSAVWLMDSRFNPRLKYLLIKYYIDCENLPFALRAAQVIADWSTDDGKSLGILASIQAKSGRTIEAITNAKRAYAAGNKDSLILLSLLLYHSKAQNAQSEISKYVPMLIKLSKTNIEAYEPLLIYGIELDKADKENFEKEVLAHADLNKLAQNEYVAPVLIDFYQSTGAVKEATQIGMLFNEALKNNAKSPHSPPSTDDTTLSYIKYYKPSTGQPTDKPTGSD